MWQKAHNKQRNKCVSSLRKIGKTKKAHYSNLNMKNIVDIKKFWKTLKKIFSDESSFFGKKKLNKNFKVRSF